MAGSTPSDQDRRDRKDRLAAYRRKRSADRTPEPFAGQRDAPRIFVVQKHAARRLHYDLRLEIDNVLHSWAVPRGPSLDPVEKRLAVEVEEHPLEYADFEGIIPAGNYGAGAVIVWDRGRWTPIGDPRDGLRAGKLLFDLAGYKLRGRWTLFRTKGRDRAPNEWLLMKKPDAWADPQAALAEESIRSGLTVEELRDGVDPSARILRRVRKAKAPRGTVPTRGLEPMLARACERPFTREGWLFELKYDGYRLLGGKRQGEVVLRYRSGSDTTALFPEIARALGALPFGDLVVDGEVVVLDDAGRPSFQRLQQRVRLRRPADVARATVELPATWFVFDLLGFGEHDLRGLPLLERKELLRRLLPQAGPLRFSDHVPTSGEALFEQVVRMRLEGLVAKRADSPYRSGRSGDWLKLRADRTGDFLIAGYSTPQRGRTGFGALHLAARGGEGPVYIGRVGTGFGEDLLRELPEMLAPDRRPTPGCGGNPPAGPEHCWVEPRHLCEVRYKEWTGAGHLRHPVFLGLRPDKQEPDPAPGFTPAAEESATPGPAPDPSPTPAQPAERSVSFTNRTKVFWPEERYTKGDLIDYYRSVARWILPYLRDRPLVLTRYPDGIHGKNFFQKDAPAYVPDWVRTETMWSEHAQREIQYFICDDEETLLYLINLGTIPLHLWASRIGALQSPDWCILDLDPKQAPFAWVVRLARAIRVLSREIGLDSYVKTSGSTGLHVLFPLGGQCTYEQSRTLAQLLARVVAAEHPDIATLARRPSARGERVYLDFVQNGHGRLLVAPYCVRPLAGAPVSTPLRWTEVGAGLEIGDFTVRTVPERVRRLRRDPLRAVLDRSPDLLAVLERLSQRVSEPRS